MDLTLFEFVVLDHPLFVCLLSSSTTAYRLRKMRQHSQHVVMWLGLLVLSLGAISLPSTAASEGVQLITVDGGPAPHTRKCWVFAHMNKSGGSSIKKMMEPWINAQRNESVVGLFDTRQWKNGEVFARNYARADFALTWGGYTEGLRSYGAYQDCKWFTMFRQ